MSPRSSTAVVRAFAWAGAVLFIVALASGVVAYAWRFGEDPRPWAGAAGWSAAAVDALLFAAFAAHHSAFARPALRAWIAGIVTPSLERSVYVWAASLLFLGVLTFWQNVPGTAWRIGLPVALALYGVQCLGLVMTIHASRQLGLFDLAGIRQARDGARDEPIRLRTDGAYGLVRHPIYFAWVLMVWATPAMTGSRLVFAVVSTIYLMLAVPYEERTLRRDVGAAYDEYARTVRWRMLPFLY